MDLNALVVFVKVVEAGSFTAAARELDMPKSTVSRKLSELETDLDAQLLHRTTRRLSLTDQGRALYRHAARVVAEAEEAAQAVNRLQETPRGRLRVTTPLSFGYLGPALAGFLGRHPEVELEVVCADRVVDLIEEGFDVAIRAGRLADSSLIARSLGALRSYVVASPGFLKRHGIPRQPSDLSRYPAVVFGAGADPSLWTLHAEGQMEVVRVQPRLVVNDFDLLEAAALEELGLAMMPMFRCDALLRAKRLRRVLPTWCSAEIPLHVVYPSTRHLSPKVRAFVEHLQESLATLPWKSSQSRTEPPKRE